MAWQVQCKYCYHVFTITPESVALDQDDAKLTVACPSCKHSEDYAAAELVDCDLARAS